MTIFKKKAEVEREKKQEVIVYLVDYRNDGDGYYGEVFFDFRTYRDYRLFLNELGYRRELENTVVRVINFIFPKRLRRGVYYALNLDILKGRDVENIEEGAPLLVGYTYNFREQRRPYNQNKDKGAKLLFETHDPLNPQDIIFRSNNESILVDLPGTEFKLRVNDVGQGNSNEILDINENVKIVYDLGASIHASYDKVSSLLDKRLNAYKSSHPLLFISHWDLDHIAQLKAISDEDMRNSFSDVVCCAKMTSLTSQKIYEKLRTVLTCNGKVNVLSLVPPYHKFRSGHSKMKLYKKMGNFVLYHGENNSNINYCGLILMVFGKNGNVILTGDSSYKQVSSVLNENSEHVDKSRRLLMIAPHHGGRFSEELDEIDYRQVLNNQELAIVSVDENDNTYGHPDTGEMRRLRLFFDNVKRTDKEGDIEVSF